MGPLPSYPFTLLPSLFLTCISGRKSRGVKCGARRERIYPCCERKVPTQVGISSGRRTARGTAMGGSAVFAGSRSRSRFVQHHHHETPRRASFVLLHRCRCQRPAHRHRQPQRKLPGPIARRPQREHLQRHGELRWCGDGPLQRHFGNGDRRGAPAHLGHGRWCSGACAQFRLWYALHTGAIPIWRYRWWWHAHL